MACLKRSLLVLMVLMNATKINVEETRNGRDPTKAFQFNITVYHSNFNISISETLTQLHCKWNSTDCYTECTPMNFTGNLTTANVNIVTNSILYSEEKVLTFRTDNESICNVTKCESDIISQHMLNKTWGVSPKAKDLKKMLVMKKACSKLFDEDPSVLQKYIEAERLCLHSIIKIPFQETTQDYDFGSLAMRVVRMDRMNTTQPGLVKISAPQVLNDDKRLDVQIPMEPFQNIKNLSSVAVVTYASAHQFKIGQSNGDVTSQVIRVEVAGQKIENLSTQLHINFTVNASAINGTKRLLCHFFDEEGYNWRYKGSFTDLDYVNSSNIVKCSYDHMTPFAVLLVDLPEIDEKNWKILSIISNIGCGLSLFFSIVAIAMYKTHKSPKGNTSSSIHASLSAALFLLNTSFLLSEWGSMWSQEGVCVFIAVMIEYSLLSCFSWMVIEAVHLYLLLIRVFSIYIKNYMLKLSLCGWGVPAVLVGISLSVYNIHPFYGTTSIKLTGTNESANICWITDARFLYGMNLTYFSIGFLFNSVILVTVTLQITRLHRLNAKVKMSKCKDISTVLGLTCLLGITWGLAFFSAGYVNLAVLYLFCILNTLQGLFLFLWICRTIRKNKSQVTHKSTVMDPVNFVS